MTPKERIKLEKTKEQNQYVILSIAQDGKVTNIENDWNTTQSSGSTYDPSNPCEFITPVNKGKKVTWIGIKDSDCKDDLVINIEYVLMNNAKGKQILKSRNYNRNLGDTVEGSVKNSGVTNGEIEDYYIVYSVNGKAFILDPKLEGHGF